MWVFIIYFLLLVFTFLTLNISIFLSFVKIHCNECCRGTFVFRRHIMSAVKNVRLYFDKIFTVCPPPWNVSLFLKISLRSVRPYEMSAKIRNVLYITSYAQVHGQTWNFYRTYIRLLDGLCWFVECLWNFLKTFSAILQQFLTVYIMTSFYYSYQSYFFR